MWFHSLVRSFFYNNENGQIKAARGPKEVKEQSNKNRGEETVQPRARDEARLLLLRFLPRLWCFNLAYGLSANRPSEYRGHSVYAINTMTRFFVPIFWFGCRPTFLLAILPASKKKYDYLFTWETGPWLLERNLCPSSLDWADTRAVPGI